MTYVAILIAGYASAALSLDALLLSSFGQILGHINLGVYLHDPSKGVSISNRLPASHTRNIGQCIRPALIFPLLEYLNASRPNDPINVAPLASLESR